MLEGQVALVTGASRGIGFGIATELVKHGASVCITARRQEQLDAALEELGADGRAIAVAGAADDEAHREAAVSRTVETFGSLDLLVNNAGINPHYGPMVNGDETVARKIMEVNVVAAFAWIQRAYEAWMGKNGGAIVNVASLGGVRIGPNIGFYNVSKAALIHMTRQLALELAPGIRVNAIAPAVVKTKFARKLYEDIEDRVVQGYPLGRLGSISDTATATRFLLSSEASWVTGHTLVLDGGMSLVGWETPAE
jgi:NAD(P)-dependent dehydrogenase (short-subunit alcohol dehydrogenase family)